mmetsp:Transcript_46246/g.106763  ORF Transcript_46246/g.106763 Transcript_46246/m.106763 type:complete len:264 (-) Transcript_46246:209-1000(-)|eukprot:CAMPEP_0171094422 /NCGR_PEP_ID=MMETSP0766_2-20121228/41085_1 /TAXON_ID=439317 /ORGANISM="Gambierdiscus australes, Strain CAWD 149" /LENGTH=263 /DNA_ID=CAMNT_0011553063 /DNA_START=64 /DNA_END=855 /DNA_ORIENTATION=+
MAQQEPLGELNGYQLNRESEDLQVPLDKAWTLSVLKSGSLNIKVYGARFSPPTVKVRVLLKFYDVPFTNVDGTKPNSPYKKMPVLDIGDRQVNDSYIIVKNLCPILQGSPMTPKQEELERMFTFELSVALAKQSLNMPDLCKCGRFLGGGIGCFLTTCACCLSTCAPAPGRDGKGSGPEPKPELKSLEYYREKLEQELSGKSFFGGSSPNVTDVSLFGALCMFASAGSSAIDKVLGDVSSPLYAWHESMLERTKGWSVFKPFP